MREREREKKNEVRERERERKEQERRNRLDERRERKERVINSFRFSPSFISFSFLSAPLLLLRRNIVSKYQKNKVSKY